MEEITVVAGYIQTLQKQVETMATGFVQQLPVLIIAACVLCITWIAARFAVRIADRITRRTPMRENLKQLVETLVRLGIWVFGLMVAATIAMPGLTPASLFAGLGVSALAIGFAFQDIFQNFLAGVLIMLRDRMRIGDNIECDKISGKIERITLRETHIRAASNELTIVPNSILFKNPVKINTDSELRRFQTIIPVAYGADLDHAREVIIAAVKQVEGVDSNRTPEALAQVINGDQVEFLVRWWLPSSATEVVHRDEIIRSIKRALDGGKVEMPLSGPNTVIVSANSANETPLHLTLADS